MWIGGDALFIAAMAAVIAAWMSHEKRREAVVDRQVDLERAELRVRETRLAERLAEEREGR
jgi:hypothetical protein